MSSYESEDDVKPGSIAESLLRRMGCRPHIDDAVIGHRSRKVAHDVDPVSLEAQLAGAGVTSPFNTWELEQALRQQALSAVDRRQHEIEAYERALAGALAELHRARAVEETRLAARVQEATHRFHQHLEALQQQYLKDVRAGELGRAGSGSAYRIRRWQRKAVSTGMGGFGAEEVEKLKRQTVVELHKQREQSEGALATRMRALQQELRYDRPTGLSPAAVAAAPPPPPMRTGMSRIYGGSPLKHGPAIAGRPQSVPTRMRSAPSARAGAGEGDHPVAVVISGECTGAAATVLGCGSTGVDRQGSPGAGVGCSPTALTTSRRVRIVTEE